MNALHELRELDQSVWYDNIHRALIEDGTLDKLVDEYAVSGVTSNPTIYERALSEGDDYDDALRAAIQRGVTDPESVFWEVAVADIVAAADILRSVHDATGGRDGFVCLELPPRLSHSTGESIEFADQLFRRVDRANVMIKVPATTEGMAAIEELIYRGVNVNVTLVFSPDAWRSVAEAHARGLERRVAEGAAPDVHSVASFFISRIDAKANEELPDELQNRLAVANAKLVYVAYREWLETGRWRNLAEAGAAPQRLLWASTSTKDPRLLETHYVSALAAPKTVDTMNDRALNAFAASGEVPEAMSGRREHAEDARAVVAEARQAGVDLEELGTRLLADGDRAFADSFKQMIENLSIKIDKLAER
ncbi:transaldolase [Haloechinothrix sp. YIM 98757]|uniref:Transaldolase n=1 Tax=Haloechinothrix aidingensis TaxID=2752311 RepID=A0A838AFD5_9PSEU|nr:transaldolase [Haloechinothrix aidingensis]MBA0127900.1 transaldolase [Haloechinothrix aidingensis]